MQYAGTLLPTYRSRDRDPTACGSVGVKSAGISPLATEVEFYQSYSWCLNPFPTVGETIGHLNNEATRLVAPTQQDWRLREVMTNVFLLSCTLLNSIDDYLRGPVYQLPRSVMTIPGARLAQKALAAAERSAAMLRYSRIVRVRQWKRRFHVGFDHFLRVFVSEKLPAPGSMECIARELSSALRLHLPAGLKAVHIRIPSAFRKQDLTHFDVLALGRKFVARFPDREQPILVVGLRTAGAYFAPLLRAFLQSEGYQRVEAVTVRPGQGIASWELADLKRYA